MDKIAEIKRDIFDIIKNHKSSDPTVISYDVEDYLFAAYMDRKINGFSDLNVIGKDKLQVDVQELGHRGTNGWVTITFEVNNGKKHDSAYNRAMRGI